MRKLKAQLTSPIFLESLKGDTGPTGPQGPKGEVGPKGDPGKVTTHVIYNDSELTADDIVTTLNKSDEINLGSTKIIAKGFYQIKSN